MDRGRILTLAIVFASGLLVIAALRWATVHVEALQSYNALPTTLYIVVTVLFIIRFLDAGLTWRDFGLTIPDRLLRVLLLGLLGIIVLRVVHGALSPVWFELFGQGRDLSRFEGSIGSLETLITLILFSWLFAGIGEELTYRGVLMRGLSAGLGDGRAAVIAAVFMQAVVFGLVHVYQGGAGVVASAISGMIFAGLVLAAQGSLWPAVIAHGGNNMISLIYLHQQSG